MCARAWAPAAVCATCHCLLSAGAVRVRCEVRCGDWGLFLSKGGKRLRMEILDFCVFLR